MSNSASYPIMLNLTGKTCLVVGGGEIATRKIKTLLDHQAWVVVISPQLTPALHRLAVDHKLIWIPTVYSRDVLTVHQPSLVFAATNNSTVNQVVAEDAHQFGAWVNVVDGSAQSDFSNMLTLERPPLTIGISTNGTSPTLAKHLRAKLADTIVPEYSLLAYWLGELREILQDSATSQAERAEIYAKILDSEVLELLQAGQADDAYAVIQEIVLAEKGVQA